MSVAENIDLYINKDQFFAPRKNSLPIARVITTQELSRYVAMMPHGYPGENTTNTQLSVSDLEQVYPQMLCDFGVLPLKEKSRNIANLDSLEIATDKGTRLHSLDSIFHAICEAYDKGTSSTDIFVDLPQKNRRLILDAINVSNYSLIYDLFAAKDRYLLAARLDYEQKHPKYQDMSAMPGFAHLMTPLILHNSENKNALKISATLLARDWSETDESCFMIRDEGCVVREVPIRATFWDMGIIVNSRIDGLMVSKDRVQVMEFKTGKKDITDLLQLELRYRQSQMMIVAALMSKNKFSGIKAHPPITGYARSIESIPNLFKRNSGTIRYRYYDKETGIISHLDYEMGIVEAREFIEWFGCVGAYVRNRSI